jgi:hypothetical protein
LTQSRWSFLGLFRLAIVAITVFPRCRCKQQARSKLAASRRCDFFRPVWCRLNQTWR